LLGSLGAAALAGSVVGFFAEFPLGLRIVAVMGAFLLTASACVAGLGALKGRHGRIPATLGPELAAVPKVRIEAFPRHAIEALRACRTEHTNVGVDVFPAHQVPLGRRIAALFELAGWQTSLNETPQEHVHRRYVEGVHVNGFNRVLMDVVVGALASTGISDVRSTCSEIEIPRDNPKFPHAVEAMRITVGHTAMSRE
jgi:hypothetical protein